MTWQVFLTGWLVVQLIVGCAAQPKVAKVLGKTDAQLMGAIAGTAIKIIGIFICLWFGGFYV